MTKFRSIIFDMDGVLLLSSSAHANAFHSILRPMGISKFDYSQIAGMRSDEAFRKIFLENQLAFDENKIDTLVKKKRELAYNEIKLAVPLAQGCFQVVEYLSKIVKLGLASSGSREMVELFLTLSDTRKFFQAIVSGEDVKMGKPSPDIFLLCAEKLNEEPLHCLIIEDSKSGIEAGILGGFPVLNMLTGKENQIANMPTLGQINHLDQIKRFL